MLVTGILAETETNPKWDQFVRKCCKLHMTQTGTTFQPNPNNPRETMGATSRARGSMWVAPSAGVDAVGSGFNLDLVDQTRTRTTSPGVPVRVSIVRIKQDRCKRSQTTA